MHIRIGVVLLAIVLAVTYSEGAQAEGGCPAGQYPIGGQGVQGCAPIPVQGGAAAPQRPSGKWHKTWGAVAMSAAQTSDAGWVVGKLKKNLAQQAAIATCGRNGATDCEIISIYQNQCVSWAIPVSAKGKAWIANGPSAESTTGDAMSKCHDDEGQGCKIVYSDCSKPIYEAY